MSEKWVNKWGKNELCEEEKDCGKKVDKFEF